MQRRAFITAGTSVGLVGLSGCLSGGSKKSVEVSNVQMKRKNDGETTEAVALVGTVKNVASNPINPTVTVTFIRKGQTLNPVETELGTIQSDKSKQFQVESIEMGRTASQIGGYKLKVTANEYEYTTKATQTPE
ncbi:hypothetical protein [Halorussus salinisoli]|uniref:hypothetical protein n=1 Tax=Halorussus salinisoli TaxID=2558242 RepID=UPI0010C18978|nr:hypothetical protein [Halorussus salinisoli]